MPETRQTLGQVIKDARTRAGLSLREVAARVPINFVYLSEIENDKNTPSEKVLRGLADIPDLKLDFDVLMSLAGKISETVFEYLKEQPQFGKIIREVAEAKLDDTALGELRDSLQLKITEQENRNDKQ